MKKIQISKDSIFTIEDTDLMGNIRTGKVISSYNFMVLESRKLEEVKDDKNFAGYLREYSAILKALIKNEMLAEMQKSISNIDTFYS